MDDYDFRQAAIEYFQRIIDSTDTDGRYNLGFINGLEFCINHLSTMPSAQSEQKTGRWVEMGKNEDGTHIIKLPCKVGDKIYKVNFPYIATEEIERINISYKTPTELIDGCLIGISAFFSREEAEEMLEQTKKWLENTTNQN